MTDPKHRALLRRALSPNLFTTTLHPEFIPALVVANLMTPRLWDWTAQCMRGVDVADPEAAYRAIHRFLNKKFYHATGGEFAAVWGLQEIRHLREVEERQASEYAMRLIEGILGTVGGQHPWLLPMLPLLQDGLFPLYVYGTTDVLRAHAARIGKHKMLGVTSCLDECVLAASLALAAGVCRWEDMIFVGSPLHYTVFFLTAEGTVWFNAKREFFTQGEWRAQDGAADESARAGRLMEKLLTADRIICGHGLAVFPHRTFSGDSAVVERAVNAVERFAGAEIAWLRPPPIENVGHGFDGCEVLMPGPGMRAEEIQSAVIERVRQGGAPTLEAALYMFRHPEFCHPELILEASHANFHAYLRSAATESSGDIRALVDAVPGRESFLGSSGRMALPDEVLAFGTGSEAERELLRRVLYEHLAAREGGSFDDSLR